MPPPYSAANPQYPATGRTAFGAPGRAFVDDDSFNAFIEKRETALESSVVGTGKFAMPVGGGWEDLMGLVNDPRDPQHPHLVASLLDRLRRVQNIIPSAEANKPVDKFPLSDVAYTRRTRENPTQWGQVAEGGTARTGGLDPADPNTYGEYEKADRIIQALGKLFAATKKGGSLHGKMSPELLRKFALEAGTLPSQRTLEDALTRRGDEYMGRHSGTMLPEGSRSRKGVFLTDAGRKIRMPRQSATTAPKKFLGVTTARSGGPAISPPSESVVQQKARDLERMAIQSLLHAAYPESSLGGTGMLRDYLTGDFGRGRTIKEGEPGRWKQPAPPAIPQWYSK